jgi:hypothetical protein
MPSPEDEATTRQCHRIERQGTPTLRIEHTFPYSIRTTRPATEIFGRRSLKMNSRFEDLIANAAEDGASVDVFTSRIGTEADQLMQAWYIERQNNIECSLFLDKACQILARFMNVGVVTDSDRRKAQDLLRAIKDARRRQRRPRDL